MMKQRIFTGWTWIRGAFLFFGIWMILESALEGQWMGILLGTWLAVMGLFGLGCAAGSCFTGNCELKPDRDHKK